ncbi:hypothetical protein GCM10023208_18990 [Erythrobacter westpacificensis]|uniref:Uncharacterized protein n=1 Tax=Erythrobacter westpacificensis TaxID=1055231 RepID=A0ABP9KEG1_9SPHN
MGAAVLAAAPFALAAIEKVNWHLLFAAILARTATPDFRRVFLGGHARFPTCDRDGPRTIA